MFRQTVAYWNKIVSVIETRLQLRNFRQACFRKITAIIPVDSGILGWMFGTDTTGNQSAFSLHLLDDKLTSAESASIREYEWQESGLSRTSRAQTGREYLQ